VTFLPDHLIFSDLVFNYDLLAQRLRELSFLNGGVKISLEDERTGEKDEFLYEGGIISFVKYLNRTKTPIHPEPIYLAGEKNGTQIEIACQYNDSYNEQIFSYANNINTKEGGTHLSGFKAALTRAVNQYLSTSDLAKNFKSNLQGEDVREGLTAVVSVKLPHPQFEGQTKTKLGNSEVKGLVEVLVYEHLLTYLGENPHIARHHSGQAGGCGPGPGSGPPGQGVGAQKRQRSGRWPCPASWRTARSGTRPNGSCISGGG
jgi:DNA gyrase subunit B